MNYDLEAEIMRGLLANNFDDCYGALRQYRDAGGKQEDAYLLLERLRSRNGVQEDMVLDLMDCVGGWCSPSARIWDKPLDTRGSDSLSLFRVEGFHEQSGRIGLLPGIPRDVIKRWKLGGVRQGHPIELVYPDGSSKRTMIDHYYVIVPTPIPPTFNIDEAPIIICLPRESDTTSVPIGTEVRLVKPQSASQ